MTATRVATLDGTWELHPMLVLQPVDPHQGMGFTVNYEDVVRLLEMIDAEPGIAEDGFKVNMGMPEDTSGTTSIIEFPPGEPARNVIVALRWYAQALTAAGPMPATFG